MEIFFMRHAEAESAIFNTPEDDFERNLTVRGQKDTLMVAVGLKKIVKNFDLILTSPLNRAYQTALIVAEVFKCTDRVLDTQALAPPCTIEQLFETIALQGKLKRVLCVGHEPYLGMMATEIITAIEEENFFPFKKCGLMRMDINILHPDEDAKMVLYIPPIILKKLGEVPEPGTFEEQAEEEIEDEGVDKSQLTPYDVVDEEDMKLDEEIPESEIPAEEVTREFSEDAQNGDAKPENIIPGIDIEA